MLSALPAGGPGGGGVDAFAAGRVGVDRIHGLGARPRRPAAGADVPFTNNQAERDVRPHTPGEAKPKRRGKRDATGTGHHRADGHMMTTLPIVVLNRARRRHYGRPNTANTPAARPTRRPGRQPAKNPELDATGKADVNHPRRRGAVRPVTDSGMSNRPALPAARGRSDSPKPRQRPTGRLHRHTQPLGFPSYRAETRTSNERHVPKNVS